MPRVTESIKPIFVPECLIGYRKSLDISQKRFAEISGVPLGTIRNWEQGISIPNISLTKLQLINGILDWKNKEEKQAIAQAREKKNAKHKVKLSNSSPLRYKEKETQGQCWERIAKIGREIIRKKMTSRYSLKRLAFIIQELPSDFARGDSDDIFFEAKKFLTRLDEKMKRTFELTYLAHNGYKRRCDWLLSKT